MDNVRGNVNGKENTTRNDILQDSDKGANQKCNREQGVKKRRFKQFLHQN